MLLIAQISPIRAKTIAVRKGRESEEEGGGEGKVWRRLLEVTFLWVHHCQFSCVMSLLRRDEIVLKTSCKQNCL